MFDMYVPTQIMFGNGRLKELHQQAMPGKKALLVISGGQSVRKNGALATTGAELKQAGVAVEVFAGIGANPTTTAVMDGARFAREQGCDFVVALGGSVMDASKAIAMMVTNEGQVWDYVSGGSGKEKPMAHKPLPVVCITTTAGTGSEVDPWGVITKEDSNEKIGLGGDATLFPVLAIIDPELMASVPAKFTAYQGFDTLFHAMEGYISNGANLMSDMFDEASIENVGQYLARAVQNGTDQEARERMALANTLSGFSMVLCSTTAEHSLEMAISAYYPSLPHGAGLIMISKAFYELMIEKHVCDERMIRMAQRLGMTDATRPEDFITALVKLQEACGVANLKMSDYGVIPDDFDKMATNARETGGGLFENTPYDLTHQDCVAVYEQSYR